MFEALYDQMCALVPGWRDFSALHRHALLSMAFNLGGPRLAGFVQMRAALEAEDFDRAADCALDSRWAVQTGRRALEIANMLRSKATRPVAPPVTEDMADKG